MLPMQVLYQFECYMVVLIVLSYEMQQYLQCEWRVVILTSYTSIILQLIILNFLVQPDEGLRKFEFWGTYDICTAKKLLSD